MNEVPRISRFCTCSDQPTHLADGEMKELIGEDLASSSVGAGSAIAARSSRFCTCSDLPANLKVKSDTSDPSGVEDSGVDLEEAGTGAEIESSASTFAPTRTAGIVDRPTSPPVGVTSAPSSANVDDAEVELSSVSELLPGESSLYSVLTHGRGGSEVVLTQRRVLLRGSPDAKILHASIRLADIDAVRIERASPKRRSLIWGLIGFGASVGMWQALDGVGNLRLFIAAAVVLMSLVLLADYFLRPPDLVVSLSARSGSELVIDFGQSHTEEADRFAARVISKLEVLTRN